MATPPAPKRLPWTWKTDIGVANKPYKIWVLVVLFRKQLCNFYDIILANHEKSYYLTKSTQHQELRMQEDKEQPTLHVGRSCLQFQTIKANPPILLKKCIALLMWEEDIQLLDGLLQRCLSKGPLKKSMSKNHSSIWDGKKQKKLFSSSTSRFLNPDPKIYVKKKHLPVLAPLAAPPMYLKSVY